MAKEYSVMIGILLVLCCWMVNAKPGYMKCKDPNQPLNQRIGDLMQRMTFEEKIGQMALIDLSVASVGVVNTYHIDPELVNKIGVATAREVKATGIHLTFAPSIAVCRDPRWGRCYERYSENPNVVRAMTQIIPGLQGDIPPDIRKGVPYVYVDFSSEKVAACAKYFAGDGGTNRGINENNTNGIKMHANHDQITDYLKDALHFKGIVISDWQGIGKITSAPHANYHYSILTSINAGIDMIMIPYNFTEFFNGLTFLVEKNYIPITRIDDAAKRILRVKFTMFLFEEPTTNGPMVKYLGHQSHRELAREAERKYLVLLMNGKQGDKPLLPIVGPAARVLVASRHADNLGYQCGGWTIEQQGLSGNLTIGTTILGAIRNTIHQPTEVIFEENPDTAYVSSFRCVVILITGRPFVIQPYLDQIDALVAAWLPGTEGQGVADVLFGDYGFSGKLSYTWFKSVDQLPMHVEDRHYDPLFPFGFGLTTEPVKCN
ncbi:hypothetical protein ACH5RR_004442 [Cinchona calisaya]|uniref:Beta-glucosidase n=1 Tax=Cinchona calisaya TaxID=153742 RepID=A0ABD3AXQ8_9GENT